MDLNILDNVDFSTDIPVYQQLASYFTNLISTGYLKVGDLLPTEIAICEHLGISRVTVRQAFATLEQDGKIIRKRRKGTFVCEPKLNRNLNNLYSFTTEMKSLGITPSSKIISFEEINPPKHIAEALNLDRKLTVYKICRLRMANECPLLLETACIPTYLCPNLSKETLNDSLYALIGEHTGHMPGEATETYEAINLSSYDAKLLSCNTGDAALRITRISKNTVGQFFEYCTIIARGDMNKYQIVLKNNGIQYTRVM